MKEFIWFLICFILSLGTVYYIVIGMIATIEINGLRKNNKNILELPKNIFVFICGICTFITMIGFMWMFSNKFKENKNINKEYVPIEETLYKLK